MTDLKHSSSATRILYAFILCSTIGGLSACSDHCKNERPRAKITNNGTDKASVQIKTSGGNTENINNIESGQVSDWRSYAAGATEFTVAIQNVSPDTMISVYMLECWEYDIQIDSLNRVSSIPLERD